MSRSVFKPAPDQLPAALPLFPLSGVLLLPGGQLPLNIFEPRYLKMTTDCFQLGRMIGIIQPRTGRPDLIPADQGVYPLGCAGRLTSFAETEDGRFIITLTGVIRFRLVEELDTVNDYRMGAVDYTDYLEDLNSPRPHLGIIDRDLLLSETEKYFQSQGINADLTGLDQISDDALVNSIAMACPFDAPEKQALLEQPGLSERADLLISLMQLAAAAPGGSTPPPTIN